jgi:glycosyltransferase involved in cell wall biosynthesis
MARRLIGKGHDVVMICGSVVGALTGLEGPYRFGVRRGNVDGIHVVEIDCRYRNADKFLVRSLKFMKFAVWSIVLSMFEKYEVMIATSTPLTVGLPAIAARWLRAKRVVFEVRDLWPELPAAMGVIRSRAVLLALSMLEWLSYRSAVQLIGLAPGICDGIARRGIDPARIALIPNGCDRDLFRKETGVVPRPQGVADSDLLAVFTGAHGIANGLDAVLDAARVLKQRGRDDIKMMLVGDGMKKPELMRRAQQEGLDNVIFRNPMPKPELSRLMAASDLGMQILLNVPAFYYGTSPNKFFDYLSANLPVLNNYPGWLADLIAEEKCGFAVPPANPGLFADALERAADNRAELEAMRAGTRRLAERFDRDLLSEDFVRVVEKAGNRLPRAS